MAALQPRGTPADLRRDLAFVRRTIQAWENGTVAPHDALTAIRDRLAGQDRGPR